MRIKQGLFLLLIVFIVVAEVSAAKQKGGKNGKNEKNVKGGKNEKNVKAEKNEAGKGGNININMYGGNGKQSKEEEPAIKENAKTKKASPKDEKIGKEEKIIEEKQANKKNKEEAGSCHCPPGPVGPAGPPGPPGECIYQPICPESIAAKDSITAAGSCTGEIEKCSCGKDCPCNKKGIENKYSADANADANIAASESSQIFLTKASGIIAIHSQKSIIPQCPLGQNKLWEGFSLMKLETNDQITNFDLGSSGSCVKNFMPSISATCDIEGQCKIGQRNDRSYWLLANGTIGSEPITQEIAQGIISRCVVCDVPSAIIAIHSQSIEIPQCPAGWGAMWIGYSYLDSSLGDQNLANAGSCLKEFQNPLFIECNSGKKSCNLMESHKSSWLIANKATEADPVQAVVKETVEKIEAVIKNETGTANQEIAVDISRCAVCIKIAM